MPKQSRYTHKRRKVSNPVRDTGDSFYHSTRWRKTTKRKRQSDPLCEVCHAKGLIVGAFLTDHMIPRRTEDGAPFDPDNLMSMCFSCHRRKCGLEAHGFSNRIEVRRGIDGLVPVSRADVIKIMNGGI